jgi:hypothetical protein
MGMFRRWAEGTLQSILAALIIALVPGTVVAYLVRIQSSWSGPILMGMCAVALGMFIVLALDAIRRLPPRRVIPNLKNIESCVREWLNNFQCAVKKSPVETAYFRYLVTVDSGTKMLIGRTKGDFQEYVQVRSDMAPNAEEMANFNKFSDMERAVVISNIKLELARRNVGYRNLNIPLHDFFIFKRVPIRESLTEHEFIAAIDEVEAATHSVSFVFALEILKLGNLPVTEPKKEPANLDHI